ncbi:GNAT family N-acetyltransferase [Parafilimonas sp.]|uniref:GNAT family N-acetyltransferase n=1 Tax=Parafilimonas sp. TaxID=1969739 RepID=UPI0039E5C35F
MINLQIREAGIKDITLIQRLTYAIWPVTYSSILSQQQMAYMLELIYSNASLQKQMQEGHHFLIVEEEGEAVAFADYGLLKKGVYKLHKIYVHPNRQGKGIGRLLIDHIVEIIKKQQASSLLLNVNRNNKAKGMYERLGFTVIGEEDIDIGAGYFMNDYIMEKKL